MYESRRFSKVGDTMDAASAAFRELAEISKRSGCAIITATQPFNPGRRRVTHLVPSPPIIVDYIDVLKTN